MEVCVLYIMGFKLLDKMLHARVRPKISPKLRPSQLAGGNGGADEAAWLLKELAHLRAIQYPSSRTLVAFLDGECAYCRPPPEIVLAALSTIGIDYGDWLAINDGTASKRKQEQGRCAA